MRVPAQSGYAESNRQQSVIKLSKTHLLMGTWITDEEDSNAAFVIKVSNGRFAVSGFAAQTGSSSKSLEFDGTG
jgi:hypothetical protein